MLPNVKTNICKLIGQLLQFLLCEQKIPKEGEREGYITESGSFNDLPFQESASVDIAVGTALSKLFVNIGAGYQPVFFIAHDTEIGLFYFSQSAVENEIDILIEQVSKIPANRLQEIEIDRISPGTVLPEQMPQQLESIGVAMDQCGHMEESVFIQLASAVSEDVAVAVHDSVVAQAGERNTVSSKKEGHNFMVDEVTHILRETGQKKCDLIAGAN